MPGWLHFRKFQTRFLWSGLVQFVYAKVGIFGVELRSNMGWVLTVVMFWCQWSWSIIGYWNPLEYITLLLTWGGTIWLQSSAIVVGFLPIPGVQTNENFWGIPTEYDSSGALFVMEILDTSASDCHSLICSSASWCIYCSQSQFISNPVLSNISETHNALLHKMKLYMILYLKEFLSGIYKGNPV